MNLKKWSLMFVVMFISLLVVGFLYGVSLAWRGYDYVPELGFITQTALLYVSVLFSGWVVDKFFYEVGTTSKLED